MGVIKMAVVRKILSIMTILVAVSRGMISGENGYTGRNRENRSEVILFAPKFKEKLVVMMSVSITSCSRQTTFLPRPIQNLCLRIILKPEERTVMTLLVLLVLSGDIEVNPGPIRHPCTICSKCVRSNQRAVLCCKCDLWTHAKCCGVSISEYQSLSDREDDSWMCPGCLMAELPFLEDDMSTCD